MLCPLRWISYKLDKAIFYTMAPLKVEENSDDLKNYVWLHKWEKKSPNEGLTAGRRAHITQAFLALLSSEAWAPSCVPSPWEQALTSSWAPDRSLPPNDSTAEGVEASCVWGGRRGKADRPLAFPNQHAPPPS